MSNKHYKENLLYLILWVVLFLTPFISFALRMANDSNVEFNWQEIFFAWRLFVPFLIVFLIHNFWVAPLLVYKKRSTIYWTTTACIMLAFAAYQCSNRPKEPDREWAERRNHPRHHEKGTPPFDFNDSLRHDTLQPEAKHQRMAPPFKDFHDGPRRGFHGRRHGGPPPFMGQQDIVALIILVLMIGMNLGIKIYFKSADDAERMQELEKKSLEQQLEYLKYQINPHFFMNTLNNIHALVDIDPEEAKHSIVELSKMMRYVLHEGAKSQVSLLKDLEFLRHYIALMRLRYTDKVKISFETPGQLPDRIIPPMLLITFVENAFKHGVSYRRPSFIEVKADAHDNHLVFTCRNSKAEAEHETNGGVGLANTRKRLDLIYGNNYTLLIDEGDDTYSVTLEIPFLTS